MTMVRWQPFGRLANMSAGNLFDEMFGSVFDTTERESGAWHPRVDVKDGKDNIELYAELPGMRKEDIKITYENNYLTISGERRYEEKKEDESYSRMERQYGRFSRTFRLPVEIESDKIKAGYTDGILHLALPKAESKKPKEISISVN